MPETLPEGTDQIVPGATTTHNPHDDAPQGTTADQVKAGAADLRGKAQSKVEELRGQATDRARDYAEQGKERAAGQLDGVAKLIGDNAEHIDGAIGAQYGDYLRRAADAVAELADALREKEVEELLDDTRDFVRRAPSIALGTAAAGGFLLARLIKAGSEALEAANTASQPKRPPATSNDD